MTRSSFALTMCALLLLTASIFVAAVVDVVPQQIHLSPGVTPSTVAVSWASWTAPTSARVDFGLDARLNLSAPASFHLFVDGGSEATQRIVYTATMHALERGQTYQYRVTAVNDTNSYSSPLLSFHTVPLDIATGADKPLRVGLLGDWGLENGEATHSSLQRLVDSDALDLIVHVGDFAYNMASDNGRVGDAFMVREQSVVGRVPYAVAPGNHEGAYNFSHYVERFAMPNSASGSPSNFYSSFNVGPVHFIAFDAERYFVPDSPRSTAMPTMEYVREQYEWLRADLEKAHLNRQQQPWIVAYAHRPMYCTHISDDWNAPYCTEDAAALRDGVAFQGGRRMYGLEQLFHNYSVDLYASGHMHSYERTYPVYREQTANTHYRNNSAMWHLVVGASGCTEELDRFDEQSAYPWSAARSDSYGYGVLNVYNATHMQWQQILDEDESVLDEVWVVKAEAAEATPSTTAPLSGLRRKRGSGSPE